MKSPRWTEITESQYPWERQALDYLRSRLPDSDPFHAWSNFEFVGADGSINEVDLLVVSTHKLYLVEIKSRPGRVTGDAGTWTWHRDGKPIAEDNPLLLANRKAKKLKSLLQNQMGRRRREMPYIDAVIFLSNEKTRCELDASGRTNVFLDEEASNRDGHPDILSVLTGGADASGPRRGARPIDSALGKAVARAVDHAGIRPSQSQRRVGDYRLESLLLETDLYQDWQVSHVSLDGLTRRVRIYPVSPQATAETRAVQRRAAEREFQLLNRIEHPGILGAEQFTEHERGPALVFKHDPEAERLDLFLERKGDALGIDVRLAILRDIAEAVAHAHASKLYHRVLSPQTILVTEPNATVPRVKVFDWQMAREGAATEHGTTAVAQTLHMDLAGDRSSLLYAAPETIGGRALDGAKLDVFSLGAIAFHLFTGSAPALTVEELHAKLSGGGGLKVSDVLDGVLEPIQELVELATDPDVMQRPRSVVDFLGYLDDVEDKFTEPQEEAGAHPLEALKGDRLEGGFTVEKRLGRGSTSVALLVKRDDGRDGVLKVASSTEQNERLIREGEVLESIRHANVVELFDTCEIRGHVALFMAMAGADNNKSSTYTLAQRLREEGRLSLDLLQRFGEDLLNVVEWLERQGISHRDIKPENVGVASAGNKGALTLVLFDFSLVDVPAENIRAGTPPYLDPFLRLRKRPRWDVYAERFAAAMTLHEMATGQLPSWGDGLSEPSFIEDEVTLDGELFDPAVREGLARFFRKALARDHTKRFDNAEEMRRGWFRVFESIDEPSGTTLTTTDHDEPLDYAALLADATRETPLPELSLSPRMLDALERMGANTVGELADLKKMRLYRNKGLGQKTVREIRDLAQAVPLALRQAMTPETVTSADDGADDDAAQRLWSVDRIAGALVGPRLSGGDRQALGAVLGLGDGAELPSLSPTRAVADVLARPWADVQRVVLAARERWLRVEWMKALRDDIAILVERHANVMTADELAEAILAKRGSVLEKEARRPPALAAARAAIETEGARDGARFVLFRDGDAVFVVASGAAGDEPGASVDARARYAARLGRRCDELADDPSVLAPVRVLEELAKVPAPAGDPPMLPERMLRLGVRASERAALSSRREIYPRGMKAVRALRLGAGSLLGSKALTPTDVQNRIRSRYPEAEALPHQHTALQRLLKEAEVPLTWDVKDTRFARETRHASPWSATAVSTLYRHGTSTVAPRSTSPDVADARTLEARIAAAVTARGFLVLGVSPLRFGAAEAELASRFELERIDVEALLVAELKAQASAHGVTWEVALRADAAAADSRDWRNLLRLVGWSMPAVEKRLMAPGKPKLLVHAGLLARYGKLETLDRLRDLCERDRGAPGYVLLLPMDGQATAPLVDGEHLPLVLSSQWARVSEGWLGNVHRGISDPQPKESAVVR